MIEARQANYRPVVVDRNVTVKNYLDRMPRIPPVTGHTWEGLAAYSLREMQTIEAMLKSEITHLHHGEVAGSLQMPKHVANQCRSLLTDQLSAVRAIRRIMYPSGSDPSVLPAGPRPTGKSKDLWRFSNHLARMFHLWMQDPDDAALWGEVLSAYRRIPHDALLMYRPFEREDER